MVRHWSHVSMAARF
uniref:Uncharacterized protein n=1 Tax=Timema poppense TaxID=170557 RepID=A0A7R9DWI2_TIMPO|nr:unnamed protein product [Timema poppensis]